MSTTIVAAPSPAPHEEDADFDDELAAVFDDDNDNDHNEHTPTTSPSEQRPQPHPHPQPAPNNSTGLKPCVPASPERDRPVERPRTILDALFQKRQSNRLTASAANIAEDAAALIEATTSNSRAQQAISATLSKKRQAVQVEAESLPTKEKQRKTRDAFRVLGSARQNQRASTFEVNERNITNMTLRSASMDATRLTALFEHSIRVDISQLTTRFDDLRAGRIPDWVLFGCLVTKHAKKEAKNGSKYAVWSLCNMPRWPIDGNSPPSTNVTLLLFAGAFQSFHTMAEGNVLAIRKPKLLPPRGNEHARASERGGVEWTGLCLQVAQKEQIVAIGICNDFRTCTVPDGDLGECGKWYDSNRMSMCVTHLQRKRRKLVTGSRMDINNAERPVGSGEAKRNTVDLGVDISRSGGRPSLPTAASHLPEKQERFRRRALEIKKAAALRKKTALSQASQREQAMKLHPDFRAPGKKRALRTRGMMLASKLIDQHGKSAKLKAASSLASDSTKMGVRNSKGNPHLRKQAFSDKEKSNTTAAAADEGVLCLSDESLNN